MSAGITFKFSKGDLRKLQRKANKLNKSLQNKVYQTAAREASKETLRAAKGRSPSRTVARALTARVSSKPRQFLYGMKITVRGGVFRDKRTARRRGVGSTYFPNEAVRFYRFLETGWTARGRSGKGGGRFVSARPFLFQSLASSAGSVQRHVSKSIKNGLERYTGK